MKKSKARAKKDAKGVFLSGFSGNMLFSKEVIKTSEAVAAQLKKLDITDLSDDEFSLPRDYKEPKRQRPKFTASFNVSTEVASFLIELFATWIGTKALDKIWDKIKDSFKYKTFKNDEICELKFKSSLDEFTVLIRFQATNEQRFVIIKNQLVPKVIQQAQKWVQQKGITHKYMIYSIKDSDYSKVPILKDGL